MPLTVKAPELETWAANIGRVGAMRDEFVMRNFQALGKRVEYIVRRVLHPHRFMGSLEDSVASEVSGTRVEIGPSAHAGGYDRGLILERGTGPIPNLPFEAIRRWAEFRGLPAGPVWMAIRGQGVKEHLWLDDVLAQGDFQVALEHTAQRIGMDLVGYAFQKLGENYQVGAQTSSGGVP